MFKDNLNAINFQYWFSIALSIFSAFFDLWVQATIWLGIAAVWFATEIIVKEIRGARKDS